MCVAGGADGIRIAKCESAQDVHTVEAAVEAAEKEFGVEVGRTLLMAALESPKGILNAYEICTASDRLFGIAISGGDFRKCMQTTFQPDGVITGAQGGHPDTAQGAKCTIVICPLLQGRIPAICSNVTTVTTPGESIDVVVTDYGVAVNPARPDILEALKKADCIPLKTIEELRDIAYNIVGEPAPVEFEDRIVGIIEARDGTILDVVRQAKTLEL